MKLFKTVWKSFFIFIFAIGLVVSASLQAVHAQTNDTGGPKRACVNRYGLSFNGVSLWARLPAVLERYAKPLRIEPMPGRMGTLLTICTYYRQHRRHSRYQSVN